MHYTTWDARGRVVATTRDKNRSTVFRVEDLVAGWREGLQLMVVGEQRRIWVPAQMAYEGKSDKPAEGPLTVDVELLALQPGEAPRVEPAPPDVAVAPAEAERTESGIRHRLLSSGGPGGRPRPHDRVRIAYAGWRPDGKLIDTSAHGPHGYQEVSPEHGFAGFREALGVLVAGDKRRFWIPRALAVERHASPVVYDIELLAVVEMPNPPPVPRDVAAVPRDAVRTK